MAAETPPWSDNWFCRRKKLSLTMMGPCRPILSGGVPPNRKRQTIWPFQTIQTLRYGFINRAGPLIQPGSRQVLDVGNNAMVRERFKTIETAVATRIFCNVKVSRPEHE